LDHHTFLTPRPYPNALKNKHFRISRWPCSRRN